MDNNYINENPAYRAGDGGIESNYDGISVNIPKISGEVNNNRLDLPALRLEWALKLAGEGFRIIRLQEGSKEPDGLWAMAGNEADIRALFARSPDMNYGVVGGNGGAIIDEDNKHGKDGRRTLANLQALQPFDQGIAMGQTLTVSSPANGFHYYLKSPFPAANSHDFGKDCGIDIRGKMGYCVGPFCELKRGKCKDTDTPGVYLPIHDVPAIQAPQWIVARLHKYKEKAENTAEPLCDELDTPEAIDRAKCFLKLSDRSIKGQNGDDQAYKTAAAVMDFGLSPEKSLELMMGEDWDYGCGWEEDKLAVKVHNAARYRKQRVGSKASVIMSLLDGPGIPYEEPSAQELKAAKAAKDAPHAIAKAANEKADSANEGYKALGGTSPAPAVGKENLSKDIRAQIKWLLLNPFDPSKDDTFEEMAIERWLPGHGYVCIVGKRGLGKTNAMLDMGLRLALDMDYHGGMTTQKGFHVFFLCGEDPEGIKEHVRAWLQTHGQQFPVGRFHLLPISVDLMAASNVEAWAEVLRAHIGDDAKAVCFIDTWQRATSSASQNDDDKMQTAAHHAEALSKSLSGPVIVACHPPDKNEDKVSGSMVIENESRAIMSLKREGSALKLKVTRSKTRGEGNYQSFRLEKVELGKAAKSGAMRTGCCLVRFGGIDFGKVDGDDLSPPVRTDRDSICHAVREEVEYHDKTTGKYGCSLSHLERRLLGTKHGDFEFGRASSTGNSITAALLGKPYTFPDKVLTMEQKQVGQGYLIKLSPIN
jgi:hypothetical protein